MAITSGFFNSVNGDRKYTAEQIGNYFEGLIRNGVFKEIGDGLKVQAGSGMNITVGTGRAFINCHWVKNSAVLTLPIAAADAQYDRIDAVKLRLDSSESARKIDIIVDTGTPNSGGKSPVRSGNVYELTIAHVKVSAAATSIKQSDITDYRSTQYCGWADILVDHPNIETSNPTSPSTESPGYGGRIVVVSNIDCDANGHVTNFEIKLLELPEKPNTKNVVAPAPSMPINSPGDTVYLNHVVDGAVVSSHLVTGGGGTKVKSHSSGSGTVDGVIEITSSCANTGTFSHNTANITIDTGFNDTPKMFKLYYYDSGENTVKPAVECRPELDTPFNLINHSGLPINSIGFEGGTATIDAATSTGLSMMWDAYI